MKKIIVLQITSLSFTGTTWINSLLGCSNQTFPLGSANGILPFWKENKIKGACLVHPEHCSFWMEFFNKYNYNENMYLQLADYTGKDIIIMNNPLPNTKAFDDLDNKKIEVKHMTIVRDGRATCRRAMKRMTDQTFSQVVNEFFYPSAANLFWKQSSKDVFCVRHEDVINDQFNFIKKAGDFLGITYPENFYQFWEFEHHYSRASPSFIAQIKHFQKQSSEDRDGIYKQEMKFYQKEIERLENEPDKPINNTSWKKDLSMEKRFIFDFYCGSLNEKWGYTRDSFSMDEFYKYRKSVDDLEKLQEYSIDSINKNNKYSLLEKIIRKVRK